MSIINLMEERVFKIIDDVCGQKTIIQNSEYLVTPESRLDIACFVLNRVPPKYISSARGYAHVQTDVRDNPQIDIDIVTLVHEGIKRVSEIRREYYTDKQTGKERSEDRRAVTIVGRFIDTGTFIAATSVTVSLLDENNHLVPMHDNRWSNPYQISDKTPGTFLFRPITHSTAPTLLKVRVDDHAYELYERSFTISSNQQDGDITLGDLYLIPKDDADNGMQLNPADEDNP